MTFANEQLRTSFHKLPTQVQFEWETLAHQLAVSGKFLHIENIAHNDGVLKVLVRVEEKLVEGSSTTHR